MIIESEFKAPAWMKNQHLQTILPRLFMGTKNLPISWQEFATEDEDFVELAWMPEIEHCKGLVVLFHGLEGSVDSHYASDFMHFLHKNRWRSVMMHFRGCGRKANRTERSYHSGDTADAKNVLAHIRSLYPNIPIMGLGFSLGANMLLKLLGEEPKQTWLNKATAISPPFKLGECSESIGQGFSKIYQSHLVRSMKQRFLVKSQQHDYASSLGLTKEKLQSLSTFYEFDDAITAPLHGFEGADDYYNRCSAIGYLSNIETETLILHAKDDPFMHPDITPTESELSTSVTLELSEKGGHVGFVQGNIFAMDKWLHKRVLQFFEQ
ncbi:MAG: hydrolase [Alteromonadaceae bacterium]|nr:hydrolase [Alteromonadaceae bacterium]